MKQIALAVLLSLALAAGTTQLPASVCPVASAPIGEACQMGCCANKCCCMHSAKSEQAPVPAAKQDEPGQQFIGVIAVAVNFIVAPIAVEPAQFAISPVRVGLSKTQPAVLCTFLI